MVSTTAMRTCYLVYWGFYSTGELIFVKLKLENASTLSFEFGRWRVFAGVTNTSKRRPSQQIEVNPLLIFSLYADCKRKTGGGGHTGASQSRTW